MWYWNCSQWPSITFFLPLAVKDVIEYLWYGQTIMLQQTDSLCPPHAGLMVWSLWPIYFVCNAGKLDSLFPDDSYIDMGEIDVGRKVAQQIPPGIFWRSQVFIDHPMYLKFNVSLSKDALVGIYGRRGLPPSHTQVGNLPVTPFNVLLIFSCCPAIVYMKEVPRRWVANVWLCFTKNPGSFSILFSSPENKLLYCLKEIYVAM